MTAKIILPPVGDPESVRRTMTKTKHKRSAQRLAPRKLRLLLIMVLLACVLWLKRDALGFRFYNFFNPIYGEIVFHGDRDGDGVPQLYHLTFNTGLRYSRIEQLTHFRAGAKNGTYSPDGTQLAFESDNAIYVMNADGSDAGAVVTKLELQREPYAPFWLNDTQIVFQRAVGSAMDESLRTCYMYAPFLFDLVTQTETPLFEIRSNSNDYRVNDDGWLGFAPSGRYQSCGYGYSRGNTFLPQHPTEFHSIFKTFADAGLLDQAMPILGKDAVLSPSQHHLIRVQVYLYQIYADGVSPSGLEMYSEGEWRLMLPVHAGTVAWSPDERYLVYDARHPDGTWVLAITSTDGRFTYPLLGNDGSNYFAPSWRP
jgi:hypothetical protein